MKNNREVGKTIMYIVAVVGIIAMIGSVIYCAFLS